MADQYEPTETGGVAESGYRGALIETARVVNVNVADWSLDLVSEFGNKRFFDIQWMSPYLHFSNGEGVYVMPEVGAVCWICKPSPGKMATPFVLGFKTEVDEREDEAEGGPPLNFRANRQTLNPGDIMMKTRDENFLILRRGGVVQIGATPICHRIFLPIGNLIRDICESYLLQSLAGDMAWQVERTDQSDAGEVKTFFRLRSKTKATDPEHAVVLTTGSHPDDENLRLSLVVKPDGAEGTAAVVQLQMDKDGNVTWICENDFTLSANGAVTIAAEKGDLLLKATEGKGALRSSSDMVVQSEKGKLDLLAKLDALLKGANVNVEGNLIALKGKTQVGGVGGEPIVKGQVLLQILTALIQGLFDASNPHGPATATPGFPVLLPVVAKLLPQLPQMLSTNNTTT